MVENENDGGWSSEEEELNFGGTMGVQGLGAIRSATFVENQQPTNTLAQKVRSLLEVRQIILKDESAHPTLFIFSLGEH